MFNVRYCGAFYFGARYLSPVPIWISDWRFEVDWDGSGTFDGGIEDVTDRVYQAEWNYGRDYASQLTGKSIAGAATLYLRNRDGRYSSFNTTSPIYGYLRPKLLVRISSRHGVNALFYSEDLTQSTYTKNNITISSNAGIAPDGAMTMDKIVEALGVSQQHSTSRAFPNLANNTYQNLSFYGRADERHNIWAYVTGKDNVALNVIFNLSSGIIYSMNPSIISADIDDTGSGNYRCSIVFDSKSGSAICGFNIYLADDSYNPVYSGDGTSGLYLWGFQLCPDNSTLQEYDPTGVMAHPITIIQWQGYLDSLEPSPKLDGNHVAVLKALGPLAIVKEKTVNVERQTYYGTGAAMGKVLDDVGWASGDRSIAAGRSTMKWWFTKGKVDALNALRDIEETECGFIRESKDGKIIFEERHHRDTSSHAISSVNFSDAQNAIYPFKGIKQQDYLKTIYNVISVDVNDYETGALAVLWTLTGVDTNPLSIGPGDSVSVWAKYPSEASSYNAVAVDAWTTTVATTDYLANSQLDGLGTDLTADVSVSVSKFDASMKITLTNNGASLAYITFLQARGTPINALDTVTVSSEDATSITKYGERTYPVPARFISNAAEAAFYCDYLLTAYKDPTPIIQLEFDANQSKAVLNEVLTRDIGDRITLDADGATYLGISQDFFVESISHSVTLEEHTVVYNLSPASVSPAVWELGIDQLGTGTVLGFDW
jgi:hypothetical protein